MGAGESTAVYKFKDLSWGFLKIRFHSCTVEDQRMAGEKQIHPYCGTFCSGKCQFLLISLSDSFLLPDALLWQLSEKHQRFLAKVRDRRTHSSFRSFPLHLGTNLSCLSCIPSPLFCLTTLHCLDLLLTFHLFCDPSWTPWRPWERRSVGWHAAHMTPSMPMSPSLQVRLNRTCQINNELIWETLKYLIMFYNVFLKSFPVVERESFHEVKIDVVFMIVVLLTAMRQKHESNVSPFCIY